MIFGKKFQVPEGITERQFQCYRDGLMICGTEYRPRGDCLPIAIVCHGFMAFQDTVRQYAIALAEMGYAAYCFDFCGGSVIKGKSQGKTTEMSVLTEVKDLEAVMAYAKSLPYTSEYGLLLMGCSQGGFVSALTAAKYDGKVKKLILFYPAFCIPDDARAGRMMFARFDPDHIPPVIRCGPMKLGRRYAADVIDMDPFMEIQPYTGDVLLIHGNRDRIVKPWYSLGAYATWRYTAKTQGRTGRFALKMLEGAGHGFSKKQDKKAIELLRSFLA